jgi:hypothetical protein
VGVATAFKPEPAVPVPLGSGLVGSAGFPVPVPVPVWVGGQSFAGAEVWVSEYTAWSCWFVPVPPHRPQGGAGT